MDLESGLQSQVHSWPENAACSHSGFAPLNPNLERLDATLHLNPPTLPVHTVASLHRTPTYSDWTPRSIYPPQHLWEGELEMCL